VFLKCGAKSGGFFIGALYFVQGDKGRDLPK